MAAVDPALGTAAPWRGDHVRRHTTPTLYYSEGSYYSQLARLALRERGTAFKSRLMDLHTHMEQVRRGRLCGG